MCVWTKLLSGCDNDEWWWNMIWKHKQKGHNVYVKEWTVNIHYFHEEPCLQLVCLAGGLSHFLEIEVEHNQSWLNEVKTLSVKSEQLKFTMRWHLIASWPIFYYPLVDWPSHPICYGWPTLWSPVLFHTLASYEPLEKALYIWEQDMTCLWPNCHLQRGFTMLIAFHFISVFDLFPLRYLNIQYTERDLRGILFPTCDVCASLQDIIITLINLLILTYGTLSLNMYCMLLTYLKVSQYIQKNWEKKEKNWIWIQGGLVTSSILKHLPVRLLQCYTTNTAACQTISILYVNNSV